MTDYDYYLNVLGWKPSFGEDLSKLHLRNGHEHAKFDPNTKQLVNQHYDQIDPNNSLVDLARHMWQSKLGKVVLIAFALGIGYTALKSK